MKIIIILHSEIHSLSYSFKISFFLFIFRLIFSYSFKILKKDSGDIDITLDGMTGEEFCKIVRKHYIDQASPVGMNRE